MPIPPNTEIQKFMGSLFGIWERTPKNEQAVFNDARISERTQINPKQTRLLSEHCLQLGWIQLQPQNKQNYILTEQGLSNARDAWRKTRG